MTQQLLLGQTLGFSGNPLTGDWQDTVRLVCIARELTKRFEQFIHGPAAEVLATLSAGSSKGEFTLVIAGKKIPKWLRTPGDATLHPPGE